MVGTGVGRVLRARAYRLHWRARAALGGPELVRRLDLLEETQRWPRDRLCELRDGKLRRLVRQAYDRIPGYRRLMREHGVRPDDIRGVADLARLPVMTKELLRSDGASLCDPTPGALERAHTGGTTGEPMHVARNADGTDWQRACYWRGFSWGGLALGAPWAQLFGGSLGHGDRPLNWAKSWFAGKVFLPAYELDDGNVAGYVRAIEGAGARHLVGYASACAQLATLVERAGLTLRLDAVFPTAEVLSPVWRATMERVFGARVLPYYGCGEVQSLGYSCPEADEPWYHSCDEHAVIEVETPAGARLEGEGSFLITDLDNFAMPLIRYRNGDAGVLAGPGCACGRTLGRILRVDGRVTDVLLTTEGAALSGTIGIHAFKFVAGVEAFQIVQKRPGHVTVRLVRRAGYDRAREEARLRRVFGEHLGPGSEVGFEYVTDLPKTRAGKVRVVVNEHLERKPSPERTRTVSAWSEPSASAP